MLFATFFTLLFSFFTSVYFLSTLGLISVLTILAYFYLTRNFGKWEKKYGIKGLKPMPLFGTEKDFLLGAMSLNEYVVKRYKEFDGHK